MTNKDKVYLRAGLVWLYVLGALFLIRNSILNRYFIGGIILGTIANILWHSQHMNKYERGFEEFEHYHWGILFIGVGYYLGKILIYSNLSLALIGYGLTLIVDETFFQSHNFAVGSNHERKSDIIGLFSGLIGLFLVWIL